MYVQLLYEKNLYNTICIIQTNVYYIRHTNTSYHHSENWVLFKSHATHTNMIQPLLQLMSEPVLGLFEHLKPPNTELDDWSIRPSYVYSDWQLFSRGLGGRNSLPAILGEGEC